MPIVRELTELPRGFARRYTPGEVWLRDGERVFEVDRGGLSELDQYRRFYITAEDSDLQGLVGIAHPVFRLYTDFGNNVNRNFHFLDRERIYPPIDNDVPPYDERLHEAFLEVQTILEQRYQTGM